MKILQPDWYSTPEQVKLRVREHSVIESPLGNEYSIHLIDYLSDSAVVPRHAVDITTLTVTASKVGEIGENFIVTLPASSTGTTTFSVEKSAFTSKLLYLD